MDVLRVYLQFPRGVAVKQSTHVIDNYIRNLKELFARFFNSSSAMGLWQLLAMWVRM